MAETVFGQRTCVELVSASHGSVQPPLVQQFDLTPNLESRTISEFCNTEAAKTIATFNDVTMTLNYIDSDSHLIDASINDSDPGATITVHNPSEMKEIVAFANMEVYDRDWETM